MAFDCDSVGIFYHRMLDPKDAISKRDPLIPYSNDTPREDKERWFAEISKDIQDQADAGLVVPLWAWKLYDDVKKDLSE